MPTGTMGYDYHLHRHGTLLVPSVRSDDDGFGLSCLWVRDVYHGYDDGGLYLRRRGGWGTVDEAGWLDALAFTGRW